MLTKSRLPVLFLLFCLPGLTSAQTALLQKKTITYQNLIPVHNNDSLLINYQHSNYVIQLLNTDNTNGNIKIYRNGNLIKIFQEPYTNFRKDLEGMQSGDLNGDGKPDFKITALIRGASPLSSLVKRKIFLLSQGEKFILLAYTDFYNEAERDLDEDKKFEFIIKNLTAFNGRNYWDYQLYSFSPKDGLVNVNKRFRFPILIRFEKKQTNLPYHLSESQRKQLSQKQPRDFIVVN